MARWDGNGVMLLREPKNGNQHTDHAVLKLHLKFSGKVISCRFDAVFVSLFSIFKLILWVMSIARRSLHTHAGILLSLISTSIRAYPLILQSSMHRDEEIATTMDLNDSLEFWFRLLSVIALVLLGGIFAGCSQPQGRRLPCEIIRYVLVVGWYNKHRLDAGIDGIGSNEPSGDDGVWNWGRTTECSPSIPALESWKALGSCHAALVECHCERNVAHHTGFGIGRWMAGHLDIYSVNCYFRRVSLVTAPKCTWTLNENNITHSRIIPQCKKTFACDCFCFLWLKGLWTAICVRHGLAIGARCSS